jgi:hypothetical protein
LPGGLGVFAGEPLPVEAIPPAPALVDAQFTQAHNRHFRDPSSSFYLCWQANLLDWLERWDPQALILEANPRYLSSRLAVRWMHRRGRPVLGWGLGARNCAGRWRACGAGSAGHFSVLWTACSPTAAQGRQNIWFWAFHRNASLSFRTRPWRVHPGRYRHGLNQLWIG